MEKLISMIAAVVLIASATVAQQPATSPAENTGPNKSIVRWSEGKYLYQTADGKRERGWEKFHLNVHPDGTRTMLMWNDISARNNQYSVMLRVAESFRPLQSYISYWTEAGYKGSAIVMIDGARLEAISTGPLGRVTQSIILPQNISIGAHPVASDGWHMWYEDAGAKGVQSNGQMYSVESSNDLTKPVLGVLVSQKFEILGKERITVPAGTFDTVRYRIGGSSDAYVLMPDRVMIRVTNTNRGLDYVLTEYKSGDNTKN